QPKERRKRTTLHSPSVKVGQRKFAVQDNVVEHVNIGDASYLSGTKVLEALSAAEPEGHVAPITKKEKQQIKRETFLQKLTSGLLPYSKSHTRRLKRRAKEQIGSGLDDMNAAIAELEESSSKEISGTNILPSSNEKPQNIKSSTSSKTGKIGEGKGTPLTNAQRKHALKLEQSRHPLILSNPSFSANPFETIRIHAQNTLVKH
ncbi:hypothetical protein AMATHDRAFT_134711, partial [Amanita thiersii Skay4041]